MGIYGPVVCYQVPPSVRTKAEQELVDLQAVAAALDQRPPPIIDFDDGYEGNRSQYMHRDVSGRIRVHVERNLLERTTLRENIFKKVSPGSFTLLVPNIDALFRGSVYPAAMLAAMNLWHGIQLLSLQLETERKGVLWEDCLTVQGLKGLSALEVENLIMANSRICQDKSTVWLDGNRHLYEDIEVIEKAAKKHLRNKDMLEILSSVEIGPKNKSDRRDYEPFRRRR
ncbi:hypothetical protein DevBK_11665 [Devosia sp. BK]|uniref:hypothetical protein n=1 Tax=Devosia sp. BK TaxID=2871706 RepID=UPI00293A9EEA|nr:hypothetical protein [Devosia sp. BK]MDV3251991.1 hypothetical protein [Devosia sp. BK]